MKTYEEKDFDEHFKKTIKQAKDLWQGICKENFKKYGDIGSCVIGAGIEINYRKPRCRKASKKQIISSREVACCQGSLNWETGVKKVLNFLKQNEIDATLNYGMMD